jgi:hypothetical protein
MSGQLMRQMLANSPSAYWPLDEASGDPGTASTRVKAHYEAGIRSGVSF